MFVALPSAMYLVYSYTGPIIWTIKDCRYVVGATWIKRLMQVCYLAGQCALLE